ncbi:MlaD family protein [Sunxiuqinia elliptica]
MGKSKSRSFKLGLFVSAGVLLFMLAVYYLGSKQNLFSSSFTVQSRFYDVKGLVEGNKVRYSGIDVGTVSSVKLIADSTIMVELSIDERVREFIRKDSKVEIGREGLMGSKLVFIHSGTAVAGSIGDNGELESVKSVDIEEMLREAQKIIDDGRAVSKNLLAMSRKINEGEGDLARLINDNTITTTLSQTGDELLGIAQNAREITEKVNKGEGDLGRLLNDTTITFQMNKSLNQLEEVGANTDTFTQELAKFGKALNNGHGLLNRLVYDSIMAVHVDTTIVKVGEGVDDVVETAEAIRESWLLNLFSGRKKKK